MSEKLTIALTKGRILKETLPLLARAGIESLEDISTSRKLVFETNRRMYSWWCCAALTSPRMCVTVLRTWAWLEKIY